MKIQSAPTKAPSFGMALTTVPKTYLARTAGENIAEQVAAVTPRLKEIALGNDMFVEVYHKYTRIENSEKMVHDMGLEVIVQEDSEKIVEPIRRFMAAHNWIERPQTKCRTEVFSKTQNIGEELIKAAEKAKSQFLQIV